MIDKKKLIRLVCSCYLFLGLLLFSAEISKAQNNEESHVTVQLLPGIEDYTKSNEKQKIEIPSIEKKKDKESKQNFPKTGEFLVSIKQLLVIVLIILLLYFCYTKKEKIKNEK